jgi:hypothetical protein
VPDSGAPDERAGFLGLHHSARLQCGGCQGYDFELPELGLIGPQRRTQAALQRGHSHPSLRPVHPVTLSDVAQGECDADGTLQYILTLETAGGFAVSFSAPRGRLSELAQAVADVAVAAELVPAVAHLNS